MLRGSAVVRTLFVLALLVVYAGAYSRFGPGAAAPAPARPTQVEKVNLNEQLMRGNPMKFYGRFRNGDNDVLYRYFSRI